MKWNEKNLFFHFTIQLLLDGIFLETLSPCVLMLNVTRKLLTHLHAQQYLIWTRFISNIQSKQQFTVAFRGCSNQMMPILLELLRHRNGFIEVIEFLWLFSRHLPQFATRDRVYDCFTTMCSESPASCSRFTLLTLWRGTSAVIKFRCRRAEKKMGDCPNVIKVLITSDVTSLGLKKNQNNTWPATSPHFHHQ